MERKPAVSVTRAAVNYTPISTATITLKFSGLASFLDLTRPSSQYLNHHQAPNNWANSHCGFATPSTIPFRRRMTLDRWAIGPNSAPCSTHGNVGFSPSLSRNSMKLYLALHMRRGGMKTQIENLPMQVEVSSVRNRHQVT